MTENQTNQISLIRGLGLLAAVSMVIGNVVGTGVFLKARVMTCNVGSPEWVIIAWIAAGVLSLAGALTYAELSAMKPEASGEYVYLRDAYGRIWGFLFGWMQIFVAKTGSQAAVAVIFAGALNDLLGKQLKQSYFTTKIFGLEYELTSLQLVAVALIIIFTLVNLGSVVLAGRIAAVFTFAKIGLILFVGLGAFIWATGGDFGHFSMVSNGGKCEGVDDLVKYGATGYSFMAGFGAAMLGALWGYDGWNTLSHMAGEVKEPQRNLPLALIGGTVLIIVLYVLAQLAYFYVLDPTTIASVSKDSSVAKEVVSKFFGGDISTFATGFAVALFTVGLMLSSMGTLHTSITSGGRFPHSMAKDGVMFNSFDKLSKSSVPTTSILVQGIWACVLALSGSFDALTDYVIFGSWIFYALAATSIFYYRGRIQDESQRPYKAFGYPIVPILFLTVAGWLLVNTMMTAPKQAFAGIFLILLGLPIYYYLNSRNQATKDED